MILLDLSTRIYLAEKSFESQIFFTWARDLKYSSLNHDVTGALKDANISPLKRMPLPLGDANKIKGLR